MRCSTKKDPEEDDTDDSWVDADNDDDANDDGDFRCDGVDDNVANGGVGRDMNGTFVSVV